MKMRKLVLFMHVSFGDLLLSLMERQNCRLA